MSRSHTRQRKNERKRNRREVAVDQQRRRDRADYDEGQRRA